MKDAVHVQAPGRINIIGDHTDYNDGFVLPAAIDKKTIMQVAVNGSKSSVNFTAENLDDRFSFELDRFEPLSSGWQNYVMGVVQELMKLGAKLAGFDASFQGDIPIGAGMSSSAALECSLAYALNKLFDLHFSKDQLIKASQMAEHHFVGIRCGIMDQFASMMGKKDQVILLDCRSLEHTYHPCVLEGCQIVLVNSNVVHELASSEYNTRRAECEEAVTILRKKVPEIINLRDLTMPDLVKSRHDLPIPLYDRCHHVLSENDRVHQATRALATADFSRLGRLLYASHYSLRDDYQVSCDEIDFLVNETLDKEYILGSRQMGGGFGGCTINLVEEGRSDEFLNQLGSQYLDRFGLDITPYFISIEDGTKEITL
ncbi:MAG: galactokinase [Saprospiraceae bacterium]|nr:galactokinase [Saprospiraceae bacterium]